VDSESRVLQARAKEAYEQEARLARQDQWILQYLPLVRHVVQKVTAHLGRHGDQDDLVSAGTVGLVRAARAYDPGRHAEFKTYAYIRIRGAVIDELRGWSFVPAATWRQFRTIRDSHRAFVEAEGRPPSDEELAARSGLGLDRYYETLEQARQRHFLSIHGLSDDQPAFGNLLPADRSSSPDAEAERKELIARLTRAIQELPDRDRQVILLYYERDLTMKEAAAVLDVTEARISQMHASALFKLSMKMRSAS
jgi:RNA polymerase sigma factor for flagellar operon FliA